MPTSPDNATIVRATPDIQVQAEVSIPTSDTVGIVQATPEIRVRAEVSKLVVVAGPFSIPGVPGEIGPVGPRGPEGPEGARGVKGDKGDPSTVPGPQGPEGVAGAQGPTGPVGPIGPQGNRGPVGATGATGPQGLKGDKGDPSTVPGPIGPQGLQGPKGDKGDPSTVPGPAGPQGLKGDTGATGPKGDKGDPGVAGAIGATGPAGPQGLKGDKGDPGDTGPQGLKGDKGDPGVAGPQGVQGIQGIQGIQGPSGQAAGKIFYFAPSVASDIVGYKKMMVSPSTGPEQTIVTPTPTLGQDVLVASFATDPGVPGAVDYPAGTASRRIYASVSNGTARVRLQVFKRTLAGVETLARDEYSNPFVNSVVDLQEWIATAASAGAMAATDRLVAKLYVHRYSGGNASTTVTTYHEGTLHSSQVQTTISAGAQGPQGPAGPAGVSTLTFRTSHGFVIGGEIVAGMIVPDLHIAEAGSQSATLIGLIARLESGTSVDISVRRNGVLVGTAKTATTVKQTFAYNQVLNDGDALDFDFANAVSAPSNLGATVIIEHVVTG